MIIFPAIDILDTKCVRLTQGDYDKKTTYDDDPVKVAKEFEAAGARYIHTVDLNAAKKGTPENMEVIKKMAESIAIPIQIGGGIRSIEAAKRYFAIGVERVIVGTAAVSDPNLLVWLCQLFPQKICLSLDVMNEEILIKGWTQRSHLNLFDYLLQIEEMELGALIVTDISKDGMLSGPSFDLYDKLSANTDLPIIASGGISSKDDVDKLKKRNLYGAIIGKALYEQKITLQEIV